MGLLTLSRVLAYPFKPEFTSLRLSFALSNEPLTDCLSLVICKAALAGSCCIEAFAFSKEAIASCTLSTALEYDAFPARRKCSFFSSSIMVVVKICLPCVVESDRIEVQSWHAYGGILKRI